MCSRSSLDTHIKHLSLEVKNDDHPYLIDIDLPNSRSLRVVNSLQLEVPKALFPLEPKIFMLRHEERGQDRSFTSSLTKLGYFKSEYIICPKLESLNIKTIYSSPLARTLQTISPFCEKTGYKVNIEWSLVESIPINPTISDKFSNIINSEYSSVSKYSSEIIEFNELKERVRNFIMSVKHIVQSENILLVTHMPVINALLSCKGFKDIEIYTHHDPGTLLSITPNGIF